MKKMNRIVIYCTVLCIILFTFFIQYKIALQNFKAEAETKEAMLNRHIDISSGLMELMQIYGNKYMESDQMDSSFFSYLSYDKEKDRFDLDSIEGTALQEQIGNITGLGSIPNAGLSHREINLALQLNTYFKKIYQLAPEIAWLYYTSNDDFLSIFPWVPSKDFFYGVNLKQANFFKYANPQYDPDRVSVWTPVYIDYAGKGLMVTYSCPLYYQNNFLGVISLDYSCSYLSQIMKSSYEAYLIDQTNCIIASYNMKYTDNLNTLDNVLNFNSESWDKWGSLSKDTIHQFQGYYVYAAEFSNAPWKMYFRVPVWKVILDATVISLPAFVICILLILALFENNKRKKTQALLTNSLKALEDYQERLEFAAKYDYLTAILNRRGMEEKLATISKKELEEPLYIILGDLDYFKKLNDTYGHNAGDLVLVECAKILKENLESEDMLCRWGGEEFLLILCGKSKEQALVITEKIRGDIESMRISYHDSIELRVTITLGFAEHEQNQKLHSSISNADDALYYGKNSGRNRVIVYQEGLVM